MYSNIGQARLLEFGHHVVFGTHASLVAVEHALRRASEVDGLKQRIASLEIRLQVIRERDTQATLPARACADPGGSCAKWCGPNDTCSRYGDAKC